MTRLRAGVLEMTGREEDQFRFLEDLVERQGRRNPILITRYAIRLTVRGRFDRALEILDPAAPNDSFLDGLRMALLLVVPNRRAEFDQTFQDYLGRYPGIGDQLFGLWLLWFAGRQELALANGVRFHQNPPPGFDRRRVEIIRFSRYLAGLLTDDEYLSLSRGTFGEFFEAHFLIGARQLGAGDVKSGIEHMRKAAVAPCPFMYSYEFARVALAIVEREPNWPPTLPKRP